MKASLEDCCTMDDSQRRFNLDSLKLEIYTHYIHNPGGKDQYLAVIKPINRILDENVLREFVRTSIGDKKLIACTHYTIYKGLDEMIAEYTNKKKKRKFNKTVKQNVGKAHRYGKRLSGMILNKLNKKYLKDAIANGEDKIYVNETEILLYGFA